MRVLAASFADREAAERVLERLRRRYALTLEDASVAPLGVGVSARPFTVLAGRFHDARISVVREFIEHNGGEVVVVVDEIATKPRLPVSPTPEVAPLLTRE